MVEFKAIIADVKDGKSYQTVVSGQHANRLMGMKIGDEFDGLFVSLPGYNAAPPALHRALDAQDENRGCVPKMSGRTAVATPAGSPVG